MGKTKVMLSSSVRWKAIGSARRSQPRPHSRQTSDPEVVAMVLSVSVYTNSILSSSRDSCQDCALVAEHVDQQLQQARTCTNIHNPLETAKHFISKFRNREHDKSEI